MALGFSSFARLLEKLGLKDIFVPRQLKAASSVQVTELVVQDLKGSVEIEVMAKLQTGENNKRKKKKHQLVQHKLHVRRKERRAARRSSCQVLIG